MLETPDMIEHFAHHYQSGMAGSLAPPGRQTAIFFPFFGGAFSRALTAEDLGVVGRAQTLEGTFAMTEEGVAVVNIRNIQGQINNSFAIVENLSNVARAEGATTLRIEGTLANDRLYNVLVKRYGMTSDGATERRT